MNRLAARGAAYVERFFIAATNLGMLNAIKVFACLLFGARRDVVLRAARLGRDIHFRGVADKGVISHFFTRGYRIVDTPAEPIRFIVDAGANIGDETIRFRYFHPEATIVALEADPGNFRVLEQNVSGDGRTLAIQKGLWSHECDLRLVAGQSYEGISVQEVAPGMGDLKALSVESVLALPVADESGHRFAEIDILKLDIEGAEYELFSRNYEGWISRVKVIIVECPDGDHPGSTARIFEALRGVSFNTYLCGENIVLIRSDVPWKLEVSAYLTRG